jgi:hypothetical protein
VAEETPPVSVAQRRYAGRAGHLAVRLQHLPDGFAVPHLLVYPAREKGRDFGILVGRRQEEVAQIADRVVLYVVHVAQRTEGLGGERLVLEVPEIEALEIEPTGPSFVGVDGRAHYAYYPEHSLGPDEPSGGHPRRGSGPNRS